MKGVIDGGGLFLESRTKLLRDRENKPLLQNFLLLVEGGLFIMRVNLKDRAPRHWAS